jgi:2-phospho-L-lactate/phosphoenolpyruvate guanylyltransferase
MAEAVRLFAVLPVKSLRAAKTRMAPLLAAAEREELARAMFHDVLAAAIAARCLSGLVVVTADEEVAAVAVDAGARVLRESHEAGTDAAVRSAARALAKESEAGMMVLPCDVPHVTGALLDELALACREPRSLVVVPSRDGGTNLLACAPVELIETSFGPGSFARHCAAAARAGVTPRITTAGGLDLDLDGPEDLGSFLALGSATRSHHLLMELDLGPRSEQTPAMRALAAVDG